MPVDQPSDDRLSWLQRLSVGPGLTLDHVRELGPELLQAFDVASPEELRRDIVRAAYLLPQSLTSIAIRVALRLDGARDALTLEERRNGFRSIGMNYRTVIRQERQGARELVTLMDELRAILSGGEVTWPRLKEQLAGSILKVDVDRPGLVFWSYRPEEPD